MRPKTCPPGNTAIRRRRHLLLDTVRGPLPGRPLRTQAHCRRPLPACLRSNSSTWHASHMRLCTQGALTPIASASARTNHSAYCYCKRSPSMSTTQTPTSYPSCSKTSRQVPSRRCLQVSNGSQTACKIRKSPTRFTCNTAQATGLKRKKPSNPARANKQRTARRLHSLLRGHRS